MKLKAISPSANIKNANLHTSGCLLKGLFLFFSRLHWVTCESSQFDTTGHVVVEEDPSSFAVALEDGVQSLRTDAVA